MATMTAAATTQARGNICALAAARKMFAMAYSGPFGAWRVLLRCRLGSPLSWCQEAFAGDVAVRSGFKTTLGSYMSCVWKRCSWQKVFLKQPSSGTETFLCRRAPRMTRSGATCSMAPWLQTSAKADPQASNFSNSEA